MFYGSGGHHYQLRTAQGSSELEAVFRFRYEHFFHCFPEGYPGLDRTHSRIFEPHDLASTHYCAFDADGKLCAVSTATPAEAQDTPPAWQQWFQLGRLYRAGLKKVVVSTRMVVHPDRRGGLFDIFYRFIMERYLDAGFECAVHFCSPGLICRYEKLGHRLFGEPFIMPPGLLRTPMLIALDDPGHLRRVDSPIAAMCAERAPRLPRSLQTALPELGTPPSFRLLLPDQMLSYLCDRMGAGLPDPSEILPVLEYASPLLLRAGLSHTGLPSGGFLCYVLSGAIREHGADRLSGPGAFVGAGLLIHPEKPAPPFDVPVDSEVLVFDKNLTRAASRIGGSQEGQSPWRFLYLACCGLPAGPRVQPGIQ